MILSPTESYVVIGVAVTIATKPIAAINAKKARTVGDVGRIASDSGQVSLLIGSGRINWQS